MLIPIIQNCLLINPSMFSDLESLEHLYENPDTRLFFAVILIVGGNRDVIRTGGKIEIRSSSNVLEVSHPLSIYSSIYNSKDVGIIIRYHIGDKEPLVLFNGSAKAEKVNVEQIIPVQEIVFDTKLLLLNEQLIDIYKSMFKLGIELCNKVLEAFKYDAPSSPHYQMLYVYMMDSAVLSLLGLCLNTENMEIIKHSNLMEDILKYSLNLSTLPTLIDTQELIFKIDSLSFHIHDFASGIRLYNTESALVIKERRKVARELSKLGFNTNLCEIALQQANDDKNVAISWLNSESSTNYLVSSSDLSNQSLKDVNQIATITSQPHAFCEKVFQICKSIETSIAFIYDHGDLYKDGCNEDVKMKSEKYDSNWESINIYILLLICYI